MLTVLLGWKRWLLVCAGRVCFCWRNDFEYFAYIDRIPLDTAEWFIQMVPHLKDPRMTEKCRVFSSMKFQWWDQTAYYFSLCVWWWTLLKAHDDRFREALNGEVSFYRLTEKAFSWMLLNFCFELIGTKQRCGSWGKCGFLICWAQIMSSPWRIPFVSRVACEAFS